MRILGLSCFYHDSAAALVEDGRIVAAAQEERFSRRKHDNRFPAAAIDSCLRTAGATLDEIDLVAFYEKPGLKFRRLLSTYLSSAPAGFDTFREAMNLWLLQGKLFHRRTFRQELARAGARRRPDIAFYEHHFSHAASAFFPSPFHEAAILTADGVGEWTTTSVAIGRGSEVVLDKEIRFPHSLGLLYSAFTSYLGFKVNSGEQKLMGLAPYGHPRHTQKIFDHLIDVKPDGSFALDQSYFDYATGRRMTNERFHSLFDLPPRPAEGELTQDHMDVAASIQRVTEEVLVRLATSVRRDSGLENLCLAGGVALNCVANGRILRESGFERVWVQPAAGDAGGAVGAALAAWHERTEGRQAPRDEGDGMSGSYLGPSFDQSDIVTRLGAAGARFEVLEDEAVIDAGAQSLAGGRCIGWFQGRMEFGPRALGARSILADPRSASMQRTLNLKIKFRESFRPFAPAVLADDASDWFEMSGDSPYMLFVADVNADRRVPPSKAEEELIGLRRLDARRSEIPAVTHVDYSARVQTVHADTNPRFHRLLTRFKELTGCPVLVNTSFNVRGEPIVCTPEDAFRCFLGTELDDLVIGNCLLHKEEQDAALMRDYRAEFELD